MSKVEQAVSLFNDGFACSQAILATYGEAYGLDRETAFRLGEGFAGGMGGMALTCGAVTGAFMVIGLKHGRTKASDRRAKVKTAKLVQEFVKRFEARHETVVCKDLLSRDTASSRKGWFRFGGSRSAAVCPKVVETAAKIIEEIL